MHEHVAGGGDRQAEVCGDGRDARDALVFAGPQQAGDAEHGALPEPRLEPGGAGAERGVGGIGIRLLLVLAAGDQDSPAAADAGQRGRGRRAAFHVAGVGEVAALLRNDAAATEIQCARLR